jgi:hypothetical protein
VGRSAAGDLSDPGRKGHVVGLGRRQDRARVPVLVRQVTARRSDFARVYDLPERMLPAEVLAAPAPPEHEARQGTAAHRPPVRVASAPRETSPTTTAEGHQGTTSIGRRAGRGGAAAAGGGGRLEGHRLPAPEAATPARTVEASGAAVAVRPLVWFRPSAPSGCSTSTTASRSTSRRPSAATATTCCRSCSATGSWPGSDLKADAERRDRLGRSGNPERPRDDRRIAHVGVACVGGQRRCPVAVVRGEEAVDLGEVDPAEEVRIVRRVRASVIGNALDPLVHPAHDGHGPLGLLRRPERGGGEEVGRALEPPPRIGPVVAELGDTGHGQRVE